MKKDNLLKAVKQAILQEAIQGKLTEDWRKQNPDIEPASELLKRIKAEKEKLIKEKKIKKEKPLPPITEEEIPFELPPTGGWVWCRFQDIAINRDELRKPISKKEREGKKKIYDYYGASGIIDKIDGYTHNGSFLLIGEDGSNLRLRTTPVAFEAKGKFWVNNHAHSVQFFDDSTQKYIRDFLNGIDLSPYITGGFQPKLSQGNLNRITIPLPPLAEQKAIVEKVEKLMQQADAIAEGANIDDFEIVDKKAYQLLKNYSIIKNILDEITKQKEYVKQLKQSILQEAIQGKLTAAGWRIKNSPHQTPPLQGEVAESRRGLNNLPHLKTFRKQLRKNLTPAEAKLWTYLKGRQLEGRKFRRQFSVANYILDFYCPAEKLAIELDGQGHFEAAQAEYDQERDLFLWHTGIKVLRFENKWVWDNPEGLLEEIKRNFGWSKKYFDPSVPHGGTAPLKGEQLLGASKQERLGNQGEQLLDENWDARVLLEKIKAEKEKLIAAKKIRKEKPLPPITEEEIPFELPPTGGWVWCRLGEIITMNYGKSLTKSQTRTQGNYAVYGSNGIVGYYDKGLTDKKAIIVGRKGSAGAIQVSQTGSWTTDVAYYIEENTFICFDYLVYLLQSLNLDKLGKGIKPGLNRNDAYLLLIPLPPLAEQKAIVEKVESLMQKVSAMEEEIQKSEQNAEMLMQAVLKEVFESKKPVKQQNQKLGNKQVFANA